METLGFFDTPTTTTSNGSPEATLAPTTAVTKTIEPNGEAVQDLWASTELDSQPLREWHPEPISPGLHSRNIRWTAIFMSFALAAGIAVVGFWLYQRPQVAGDAAIAVVNESAANLSQSLANMASYPDDLTAGVVDRDSSPAALTFPVNEAARSLFSATGDLPASEGETRALAADAATLALDASGNLTDVTAFYMTLDQILMAPPLETDSSLVDLTAAALDFGGWRARVETVASALPVGVASDVTTRLNFFIGSLDRLQGDYLNALRAEERFEAVGVVESMTMELDSIRIAMKIAIDESAATISDQIGRAQAKLDHLLG